MRSGLRIGRLFGIELTVDWSWVFIALLMTWNLASVFSRWHTMWGASLSLVVAAAAALLFFASVVVHELAHSLVARALGMRVKNITLFLFGGVSNLEREPPSARAEFLIAIVGPITSIAIGVLCLLLAGVTAAPIAAVYNAPREVIARLGPAATLLAWLGPANIMVGLFNLVPGFPLDGGRVLRAALWGATKDLTRATRWATRVGQAIGWALAVAGVAMVFGARVPFFGTGAASGVWLAFIGWFLSNAAAQSYQQVLVERALEGVTAGQLMRTRGVAVGPATRVAELVRAWATGDGDDASVPVLDETSGALLGVVDLEAVRALPRERWGDTAVSAVMTPRERVQVASPDDRVTDALAKMGEPVTAQVPVVDRRGRLVGMLRRRDVSRWLEIQMLPDERHTPPRGGRPNEG